MAPPTKERHNFFSILSSQEIPDPINISQNTSPSRKRRIQEPTENSDPQPSCSKQNYTPASNHTPYADAVNGNKNKNQKQRKTRKQPNPNSEKQQSESEPSGGTSTPNEDNENLVKKNALKNAIRARIVALKMNPILLTIADCLLPPILNFFWPMISPFVSFILPFLLQDGSFC
jgi:hypothetical protein